MKRFFIIIIVTLCYQNGRGQDMQNLPADSLLAYAQKIIRQHPDSTIWIANEVIRKSDDEKKIEHHAFANHLIGTAYLFKSKIDSARSFLNQAVEISLNNDLQKQASNSYNNLGLSYHNQGYLDQALQYYLKSYEIDQSLNNLEGVNGTRINLGRIYSFQEKYDKALENYEQALEYFQSENHYHGRNVCLNNIGFIHQKLKNLSKAKSYFEQALVLAEENQDLYSIASDLNNLGRINGMLKQPEKGKAQFYKAIQVAKQIDNEQQICHSYHGLAEIYLQASYLDSAQKSAELSLQYAKSIDSQSDIKDSYDILHRTLSRKKQFEQAYQYLILHRQYRDSLFNIEKEEELNRLQLTIQENENEQLKQEKLLQAKQISLQESNLRNRNLLIGAVGLFLAIAIVFNVVFFRIKNQKQAANRKLNELNSQLQMQNQQIAEQKEELAALNDMKDKILSTISHDFRSPLNMIKSLLDLFNRDMMNEQELQIYLPKLANNVTQANEMLNNLLVWAKKQFKGYQLELESIDVSENTAWVVKLLQQNAQQKNIEIDNQINREVIVKSEPEVFNIILRNLVNNAIKFTPENGKITIEANENEQFYYIIVTDTGRGIDQPTLTNLNSDKMVSNVGTNAEDGIGIGLFICKQLISANGGTLHVESSVGDGSKFSFSLPKP